MTADVNRTPETCPHRVTTTDEGTFGCGLAGKLAYDDNRSIPVEREACATCSRQNLPSENKFNGVVASLVIGVVGVAPRDTRGRSIVARALEALELSFPGPGSPSLPPGSPPSIPPPEDPTLPTSPPHPPPPPTSAGSGLLIRRPGGPIIGLVGPDDSSGIGALDRDLAAHLKIARWLVPGVGEATTLGGCRRDFVAPDLAGPALRSWARGLDWVLFAEDPVFPGLVWRAREMGAGVACVPMWEWTNPDADWLRGVDLMICPTVHAFERLLELKLRHGFDWELTHIPWPVEQRRFTSRPIGVCRRFLYVNGRGGCLARYEDGTPTPYRRKGLDVILEAARRLPDVPFLIRSQVPIHGPLPPNVEVKPSVEANERLYDVGDVCVQPSRWEGIGLSLLECQASGLPLVTTDGPPMNEFVPFRAVVADRVETVYLDGDQPVPAHLVDPDRLAETLGALVGTDVSAAGRSARVFVERNHNWVQAARLFREALAGIPVCR